MIDTLTGLHNRNLLEARGKAILGIPAEPTKRLIDKTIEFMLEANGLTAEVSKGWTEEEFSVDLKEAHSKTKLKDAIREARDDYREGRVKPFSER